MSDSLKRLISFLIVVTYIFAVLGGTAYLFYFHVPQFGVANIALAAMAFPFFRDHFKILTQ